MSEAISSFYEIEVMWPVEPMMIESSRRHNSSLVRFCAEPDELPNLLEVLRKDGFTVAGLRLYRSFASINDAADEFFRLKLASRIQQPSKVGDPASPDETSPASVSPSPKGDRGTGE